MNNNVQIFKTMALTLSDGDFEEAFGIMQTERDMRRQRRARTNKGKLHKGSLVEWTGSRSGTATGEVVRVKTKKAIVKQTSKGVYHNTNWDIPMSMLNVVG
jgi:hypothetical protein